MSGTIFTYFSSAQGKRNCFIGVLLIIALLSLLLCPFVGHIKVPFSVLFDASANDVSSDVFWKLRLPRVCLAFLAGAALAVSGMAFQAVFRNVLADPFTLGIASGSAFGAALAGQIGVAAGVYWFSGGTLYSFAGALATMFLVVILSAPSKGFSAGNMLLAGVIIGFFFSSLILLLQYIGDFSQVFRITRWLMGSLDIVGFEPLFGVAPVIIAGMAMVFVLSRQLDLLTLGDELAISRGLNARRARVLIFVATSMIVAGVVSVCGPIGFVGLVVPYVCRAKAGVNHRRLFFCAILLGGSFLSICDTFARVIIAPSEIPVGVITALLGGPFFLWVLSRSRNGIRL